MGFMRHLCLVSISPTADDRQLSLLCGEAACSTGREAEHCPAKHTDAEKTYFSQLKEGRPIEIHIHLSVSYILNISGALHSWVTQCGINTAVLVRRNTYVVWLGECSPAGEGGLTAM